MKRRAFPLWAGLLLALALVGIAPGGAPVARAATTDVPQASWAASMRWSKDLSTSNFTCRFVARTSVGGSGLRLRLSNAFGTSATTLGPVRVGVKGTGAAVSSNTQVTFGGAATVMIPAGQQVWSDRVDLAVAGQQDLAVSIATSATTPAVTSTPYSQRSHWCTASGAGDHTADTAATAFTESTQSAIYWLTALDVYRPASTGAVVVLGDSITQGVGSTTDANTSWVARLSAQQAGLPAADDAPSVVNAGIAGNMACDDSESWGPGGTARLDRDVLGQTDARTVLLFLGTNDIAFGGGPTYPGLTSSQVITCLTSIAKSAHAAGLRVVGATSIPRSFTGDRETYRTALNTWVRTTGALDGYVDFDAAVRSATDPTKIATSYDSDGVHPNDAGHQAMANAVDTALLGTGESVLGDGGLESGELGVWSQYPSGTATVGTTGVHSGSKALAIADPNAGVWRTLTTLKPNTTYTLAGWLSRSSGPGDYLFVKVDGVEARSAESSSASPAYASVTFTTGATGTATVGVWRTTGAGGTAHADDLALVRASANPVPDPGFESGALGGWTASASNAATVGTTGVHGGSKALTITGANAGVYRTVTGLRANTSYTWSGWLSRSSAAGSIWLCANGGGTTLNSAMVTSASPQLVAVTATSDASGSLTLCAWAYDPSTSVTGYVDDVRLARTS